MEEERKFKGIWIPREIWLSEELTLQEKVLLVEIDSLEDEEKGCYANNNYFARFFKLSNRRIAQIIASLKEKGYLNISYQYKGKEIELRTIRIMKPPYPEVVKVISVGSEENFQRVGNIFPEGSEKNCRDNNISINNINNNKKKEDIYKYISKKERFIKPTIEEIKTYCIERNNNIDPEMFYDFYESKNWYVGKNKMKDWKASVRTWERSSKQKKGSSGFLETMKEIYDEARNNN